MKEEFLNQGIKDLITRHPAVGEILGQYGIGCVPCSVGTCLLKDVVDIHNLSSQEEAEMMARIDAAVRSGGQATSGGPPGPSAVPPARPPQPRAPAKVSPVMRKLMDEHLLIKRFLAVIPRFVQAMDLSVPSGRQRVLDAVDFIRSYADRYHHAKEEEILFKCFDEGLDILKVIREDHQTARAHVQAIYEAVQKQDRDQAAEHLEAYGKLLTEHITKEDEILYPWLDRQLSDKQIGRLFSEFGKVDEQFGDAPARCRRFLLALEDALDDTNDETASRFENGTRFRSTER